MATTDLTYGLRQRSREHVVEHLVRLLQRCDEFDVLFEDCLDEAEARFLELVDAQAECGGLAMRDRTFDAPPAPGPIVLVASPAKVRRYHARNTIVEKLAARCVSWDIGGLAMALGRSVRYVHSLVREEPRTRIEPQGHARVAEFRVSLRSWPTQG